GLPQTRPFRVAMVGIALLLVVFVPRRTLRPPRAMRQARLLVQGAQSWPGPILFSHLDETLHVDWNTKQQIWRLPEIKQAIHFDVQGVLGTIAVLKNNLAILMKRSNWTQSQNVAPIVKLYLKTPLEMGDPNVLICFADRFSPPVLKITWLKNGQLVSQGVEETAYFPSVDNTFRKFSYLPLVPEDGDIYTCQVEHWGLDQPLQETWTAKAPTLLPETLENMVCALGLAVAILGIITGPIIFIKARRMRSDNRGRGAL
uniref:Ig-like domain-containing protein n=1 Tax=Salvator merianae TaxID=96440 RepID=A0A8D0DNJ4_SALMN